MKYKYEIIIEPLYLDELVATHFDYEIEDDVEEEYESMFYELLDNIDCNHSDLDIELDDNYIISFESRDLINEDTFKEEFTELFNTKYDSKKIKLYRKKNKYCLDNMNISNYSVDYNSFLNIVINYKGKSYLLLDYSLKYNREKSLYEKMIIYNDTSNVLDDSVEMFLYLKCNSKLIDEKIIKVMSKHDIELLKKDDLSNNFYLSDRVLKLLDDYELRNYFIDLLINIEGKFIVYGPSEYKKNINLIIKALINSKTINGKKDITDFIDKELFSNIDFVNQLINNNLCDREIECKIRKKRGKIEKNKSEQISLF